MRKTLQNRSYFNFEVLHIPPLKLCIEHWLCAEYPSHLLGDSELDWKAHSWAGGTGGAPVSSSDTQAQGAGSSEVSTRRDEWAVLGGAGGQRRKGSAGGGNRKWGGAGNMKEKVGREQQTFRERAGRGWRTHQAGWGRAQGTTGVHRREREYEALLSWTFQRHKICF